MDPLGKYHVQIDAIRLIGRALKKGTYMKRTYNIYCLFSHTLRLFSCFQKVYLLKCKSLELFKASRDCHCWWRSKSTCSFTVDFVWFEAFESIQLSRLKIINLWVHVPSHLGLSYSSGITPVSKLIHCVTLITSLMKIQFRKGSIHLNPKGAFRYVIHWLTMLNRKTVHKSVLNSFGIQSNSEELDLPYIYWTPKMHKSPYKHRFIAASSKCSTKPLSILLTKLLTHIKQGLQKYCDTAYSRSGVNQMWILKNSKELLDHLKSPNFILVTNIKSFDFSTLYTTIPHQKLKSRLATIIRNAFLHKNGNRRYKYLV